MVLSYSGYYTGLSSRISGFDSPQDRQTMESNAAGLVLRPALKTGFSEMGWGSTPLLSANNIDNVHIRLYNYIIRL